MVDGLFGLVTLRGQTYASYSLVIAPSHMTLSAPTRSSPLRLSFLFLSFLFLMFVGNELGEDFPLLTFYFFVFSVCIYLFVYLFAFVLGSAQTTFSV